LPPLSQSLSRTAAPPPPQQRPAAALLAGAMYTAIDAVIAAQAYAREKDFNLEFKPTISGCSDFAVDSYPS
jgi:hypothetical protein